MGGSYYDRDVIPTRKSSGSYYSDDAVKAVGRDTASKDTSPKNRSITCSSKSALVISIDGTGSMGNDAYTIYDKLPMFYGQLMMQGYLPDPAVSFSIVGDAYSDQAPIQICDFAQGNDIESWIKKLWIEHNGGGQHFESYDLTALFYARHCNLLNVEKPLFFFIGDEGVYPKIEREIILTQLGYNSEDVDTKTVFRELNEKFQVFLIHRKYNVSYLDTEIVRQWKTLINPERVVILTDPKAIIDVILGLIAIQAKTRDLQSYLLDLNTRGQTPERVSSVRDSLTPFANSVAMVKTEPNLPEKVRKGISKRL